HLHRSRRRQRDNQRRKADRSRMIYLAGRICQGDGFVPGGCADTRSGRFQLRWPGRAVDCHPPTPPFAVPWPCGVDSNEANRAKKKKEVNKSQSRWEDRQVVSYQKTEILKFLDNKALSHNHW